MAYEDDELADSSWFEAAGDELWPMPDVPTTPYMMIHMELYNKLLAIPGVSELLDQPFTPEEHGSSL